MGNVSFQAVKAATEAEVLERLICFGYSGSEMPTSLVKALPLDWPQKLKGHRYFYPDYLKDSLFDWLASRELVPCDLFHSWNNHCLKSMRRAKELGARTIVERNSLYPSEQAALLKEEYARFGVKVEPTSRASLQRGEQELQEADYVFCPSTLVRESLLANGLPDKKICLLPQGVETKRFAMVRKTNDEIFRAIFIGHLGFRKGLPYLLQAWDKLKLPEAELVLIGGEEPEAAEVLRSYRGRPDIVMTGYTDINPYLAQGTVFVCPSVEDGFGLVVLEAMAAGLPVIVSANTGVKDAVREGKDGYIVPIRDVEALAGALESLYADRGRAYAWGQQAVEQAQHYDWSIYRRRLLRIYENLL